MQILAFLGVVLVCAVVFQGLFWLAVRLMSVQCPVCGSKWRTELYGEWDGVEMWQCHACGYAWDVDETPRLT